MATAPDAVRAALTTITGAAISEVQAVSQAALAQEPASWRAAMFAAVPLIVSEYAPGSSTLALDWFDEIRTDARPPKPYTPTPRLHVTDDDVAAAVARTTTALADVDFDIADEVDRLIAEANAALEAEVQLEVASGFWDTITENTRDDPSAIGWRRFARPGACKFCVMLADRGAVFTEQSVRFAAHTNCHCVVGQSYDPDAPGASVEQYLASRRRRSAADRARLRAYLNENYPDAPG